MALYRQRLAEIASRQLVDGVCSFLFLPAWTRHLSPGELLCNILDAVSLHDEARTFIQFIKGDYFGPDQASSIKLE
jgi:hypothetical protein